jgi:hypothetical protein
VNTAPGIAAAGDHAHLALDRAVGADDEVGVIVDLHQVGMGEGHAGKGFLDHVFGAVDEFLHGNLRDWVVGGAQCSVAAEKGRPGWPCLPAARKRLVLTCVTFWSNLKLVSISMRGILKESQIFLIF